MASSYIYVSSGETSTGLVIKYNTMYVLDGGTASKTTADADGLVFVDSNGSAFTTVINSGGILTLLTMGVASDTTINSGGSLGIWNNGMASGVTVNPGGILEIIYMGGSAIQVKENGGYVLDSYDAVSYVPGYFSGLALDAPATVHSGTVAERTILNNAGRLIVYRDGMAKQTTVNSGGEFLIFSGGSASDTIVYNSFGVYGGSANSTTVNSGGSMVIDSSGLANETVVNPGGTLVVYSGGTALQITENGGLVYCSDEAEYTFLPNVISGATLNNEATVHSGTTVTETVLNARLNAYSGGIVSKTSANHSSAWINIYSGAIAESNTVNAGGIQVYSGGTVNHTTLYSGYLNASSATVDNTTLNDGVFWVNKGTTANNTVVNSGSLILYQDATVNSVTVNDGKFYLHGTANSPTLNGGVASVCDGATANSTVVSGGVVDLLSGGTMNVVKIYGGTVNFNAGAEYASMSVLGGTVNVSSGACLTSVSAQDGRIRIVSGGTGVADRALKKGRIIVGAGGNISGCTAISSGRIEMAGGSALATEVAAGGTLTVDGAVHIVGIEGSNGIASNTRIHLGGVASVGSGGVMLDTVVAYSSASLSPRDPRIDIDLPSSLDQHASLYITSKGVASGVTASKGAIVSVDDQGMLISAKVSSGASATVMKGGSVSKLNILRGGEASIAGSASELSIASAAKAEIVSGGSATDVTVATSGLLRSNKEALVSNVSVSTGGTVTGIFANLSSQAVTLSDGILDFDISALGVDDICVEQLNFGFGGTYSCTLTVGEAMASRTYKLAGDAAGFDKNIKVVNTSGTELGTLTVNGGETDIGGVKYTLALDETDLTVTISGALEPDTVAPVVSNVAADITAPTNGSVTVTADFTDNVAVATKQYKIGDGAWMDYVDGVVVSKNATVYFKSVDTSGNESEVADISVTNIDKVAPTISGITPGTTAPSKTVTITADFADDVELASKQYKIGAGEWIDYTTGVTVTSNTTIYFLAVDTAGNETEADYAVTNIDRVAPTITNITPNTTELTDSVTVTADFADDVALASKQYKIGMGDWKDYTTGVTVTANTTVHFKAVDAAGNEATDEYRVTNIETADKVITGDITGETRDVPMGWSALEVNINADGRLNVLDGGVASNTNVNSKGELDVYSGGVTDNTLVRSGGMLQILSDGEADNTVVNSGGRMFVSSGGTANTVSAEGTIGVYSDGVVSDATVNYNARLYVLPGGTAFKATVNNQGYFCVSSGGTASDITVVSGGSLFVDTGGAVDQVNAENGAYLGIVVTPDTSAKGTSGGIAFETKDGILSGFTNSRGHIDVVSGGVGCETTVDLRGTLGVSKGGRIEDTVVNENGSLMVGSDGTVYNTTVHSGGIMKVSYDGKVTGRMTFDTGAAVSFDSRAFLDFDLTQHRLDAASLLNDLSIVTGTPIYTLTVDGNQSIGSYKLADGAAGFSGTVTVKNALGTSLGTISVDGAAVSFGIQQYTLKRNESNLYVEVTSASGTDDLFIGTVVGETKIITAGKSAIADVGRDGILLIESEGNVSNTIIRDGGLLVVSSGGKMAGITVEQGGKATVSDSVVASSVVVNGGEMLLESGASAIQGHSALDSSNLIVKNGGKLIIDGGKVAGVTVSSGHVVVADKGLFYNGTCSSANVVAQDGATVSAMTFIDGGILNAASGAVLKEITLYEGGAITGILRNASKLKLNNGTLELNIGNASPGSEFLVDAASFGAIQPTDLYSYRCTLAVGDSQAYGTYKLIEGAVGFDKSITVVNASGTMLDTLALGATTNINGVDYELNLGGDNSLTVTLSDTVLPVVSNMVADITTPTNGSVTVTADFTDNVGVIASLYKTGDGAWIDYTDAGVIVNENTTIFFKAIDAAGNESRKTSYAVTNIDKVVPTITGITPSTTEPARSVTVTADFADDVALASQQYKIGDGAWQDYTTGVTVTENGTIYFKAIDAAGNETTDSYEVTNIQTLEPDTTKPTVINVAADITAQTNGNVTVTAEFTDNVAVAYKYYTLSLYEMWQDYPDGGVVVTENNTTVYFEAVDTSGNVSEIVTFSVTNIDKEAPTITGITPSTTAPAASVAVTATFSDNVALAAQQYKIGGGAWQNYVDGVLVTENALVTFKAVDTAGNETTETYDVTNIEPTGSSITGDITGETKDVPAGWTALNVNVNTGGKLNVLDGGVASNTNVNAGGRLYVSSGGIARDTTVNDGGLIEGSGCEIDGIVVNSGGSLLLYSEAKLTGQMTFASGAEVIPFVGSILDFDLTQTEPGSPALVNDLSILMGTPTYTITVDNSQALGTYKLAGGAAGFDKPITVRSIYGEIGCTLTVDGGATKLGDVYLTLALSGSDLTFTISEDSGGGIIPDNKPDDGKNDYLYKKKADPEWNNANIHVTNEITGNGEVRLDLPGTIDTEDGKHNLFGHDKDNMDTGDVAQVEVNDPAKLTFTIDSNAAGTFFVYEDGFDKKGNRKMITVKKVTVKAGKLATLKDVCLTSTGKYYVAMTAKNVKKVGTEGLYNVNVIESKFFVDADEGANKNNTADEGKTISVGRDQDKNIVLDGNPMKGSTEFNSFVGFTDGKDYAKLDLTDSAYLKFHVTGDGDGKAKFTIWKQTKGTTGKLSKVTSVSLPAKKVYDATTKAQFLDASKYTYYVSMECTDAAKGKGVYYNVQITDDAVFFDSNDDGKNNILYDKKAKSFYVEDANHHFESTTIGTGTHVKLDTDPVADTDWENFVGYQDAADYAKIELASDGKLNFHLEATGDATFTVYRKGQDKKGNDTLETIQTAKLAVASGASKTEKDIQISDLEAGEYYVSMAAKSTKANSTGSVFYNVTATLDAVVTSALEMPMAAATYADSVQDKLFGETGNGLLASL